MARTYLHSGNIPRGNGELPQIKFELFGEWEKTMSIMKRLGPTVKVASVIAQMKVGKTIAVKVRNHIRNQDLGWTALSEKYAIKKSNAGLQSGTLMAYNNYINAIKVWQSGNKHLVMVGVKRGIYTREANGKRSKIEIAEIAGIHEFSNGNRVPRRPLWNPTITELGGAKGLQKMYINTLAWHLREMGIPVVLKRGLFTSIKIDGTKIKY